jgi:hypothetical protein
MKFLIAFLLLTTSAFSADVRLDWDAATGATGYNISMSTDLGVTWQTPVDAGMTKPFTYPSVPEDKMIIFKIAAYNTVTTEWNNYAGAWYDHRLKLSAPVGAGIK